MDPTIITAILAAVGGALTTRSIMKGRRVHPSHTTPTATRDQIIEAYGNVLVGSFNVLQPESKLPFPKDAIRRALASALLEKLDPKLRSHFERAYLDLECFLPLEEYEHGGSFAEKLLTSESAKRVLDAHTTQGVTDKTALYSLVGELQNLATRTDIFDTVSKRMGQRTEKLGLFQAIAEADPTASSVRPEDNNG